jgi:hypothetical protein
MPRYKIENHSVHLAAAGKGMLRILGELLRPIPQLRLMHAQVLRACAYDTPRSLIRRTASSLNTRVNFPRSMTRPIVTPNLVSSEPGAGQCYFNFERTAFRAAARAPVKLPCCPTEFCTSTGTTPAERNLHGVDPNCLTMFLLKCEVSAKPHS